jgi:hypothetical protein
MNIFPSTSTPSPTIAPLLPVYAAHGRREHNAPNHGHCIDDYTHSYPPSPTSGTRLANVHTTNRYDCPNLYCTIDRPHIYRHLTPIPTRPRNVSHLHIRRFHAAGNPFPRLNCWQIVPPVHEFLEEGRVVYLRRYGVVKLQKADEVTNGWQLFRCEDEGGDTVTMIAAKEEWCQRRVWLCRHRLVISAIFLFFSTIIIVITVPSTVPSTR